MAQEAPAPAHPQNKGSANRAKTLACMGAKNDYKNNVARDFSHQTSHTLVRASANGGHAPVRIGLEALKVMSRVKRPGP